MSTKLILNYIAIALLAICALCALLGRSMKMSEQVKQSCCSLSTFIAIVLIAVSGVIED